MSYTTRWMILTFWTFKALCIFNVILCFEDFKQKVSIHIFFRNKKVMIKGLRWSTWKWAYTWFFILSRWKHFIQIVCNQFILVLLNLHKYITQYIPLKKHYTIISSIILFLFVFFHSKPKKFLALCNAPKYTIPPKARIPHLKLTPLKYPFIPFYS